MHHRLLWIAALSTCATSLCFGQYTLEKLNGLSVNYSGAWINNSDQVVTGNVLWDQGTLTTLPGLGGGYTYVRDINNLGEIVGYSSDSNGVSHAVVWNNGAITALAPLAPILTPMRMASMTMAKSLDMETKSRTLTSLISEAFHGLPRMHRRRISDPFRGT